MSANPTTSESLVAELTQFLAGRAGASPEDIHVSALTELPQRQLLEVARLLGLTTVSRLKKDLLVERLWKAWSDLLSGAGVEATPAKEAGQPEPGRQAQKGAPDQKAAGQAVAPVAHKFELRQKGAGGTAEPSKDIPWGYGRDRVTAMAVDPDRLFVYWEVTEEALERARKTLGSAGGDAWLNLRLYDTTGRIFDGWNAHSTLDQGLDRAARQWFFTIGKPSSETIVEIGLLAKDGSFAKIARSGRVEFPRKEPVAWTEPEWLTVRLTNGQVRRAWLAKPGRPGDAAPGEVVAPPSAVVVAPLPVALPPPELVETVVQVESESETIVHRSEWHSEWEEVKTDGVVMGEGRLTWEEHSQITSWSEGPFPYPVEVPEPVRETSVGRTRVFRAGAKTHVVYGPWQVVIHGLGATRSRSVISRWEVYRSWGEETGRQIVHTTEGHGVNGLGASEHLMRGASERVWRGGSELRLGGSSELYFIGASELRLSGASERMYMGASERLRKGASERRLSGEAAWNHGGGSEGRLGGASDYVQKPLAVSSDYPRPVGGPPQAPNQSPNLSGYPSGDGKSNG
ncbi:MAG TPA: DUF4912 domain-containing protein [Polyangia bacterium]